MLDIFKGKVFVVGDNTDTDQIIPAKHLVYSMKHPEERLNYGKYALSGLMEEEHKVPFISSGYESEYSIIIAGENFGCGSSREQAPASLMIAGVKVVLAKSFARIFYRNVIDVAYFIPLQLKEGNNEVFKTGDTVVVDIKQGTVTKEEKHLSFYQLGEAKDILEAGGIFAFARENNWIK